MPPMQLDKPPIAPVKKMLVHFRSKIGLWATPLDFFDVLDQEFGFELDVCALAESAPFVSVVVIFRPTEINEADTLPDVEMLVAPVQPDAVEDYKNELPY